MGIKWILLLEYLKEKIFIEDEDMTAEMEGFTQIIKIVKKGVLGICFLSYYELN